MEEEVIPANKKVEACLDGEAYVLTETPSRNGKENC